MTSGESCGHQLRLTEILKANEQCEVCGLAYGLPESCRELLFCAECLQSERGDVADAPHPLQLLHILPRQQLAVRAHLQQQQQQHIHYTLTYHALHSTPCGMEGADEE